MKIHPVFHVSLLERYSESEIPGRSQPPSPPVLIDNELEYEVEEILDSKLMRNRLFYLVNWKGSPVSENSWEPASHLLNSSDLIREFHTRYPQKPAPSQLPKPRTPSSLQKSQFRQKVNFVNLTITHFFPKSLVSCCLLWSRWRLKILLSAYVKFLDDPKILRQHFLKTLTLYRIIYVHLSSTSPMSYCLS